MFLGDQCEPPLKKFEQVWTIINEFNLCYSEDIHLLAAAGVQIC